MRLPFFPLSVVLLPGTPMPLHLFEPRYRQMLADVLAADRTFVLGYRPPGVPEDALPRGWPVCLAIVEDHEPLPDGRSNILVRGGARVALAGYRDDPAPYHVVEVAPLPDEPHDVSALGPLAAQARQLFARVAAAARALADDPDPAPSLPDDPARLAWAIAAAVDLDPPAKHQLLAVRDPSERLQAVLARLMPLAADLEQRAAVHRRASTNGHGPH